MYMQKAFVNLILHESRKYVKAIILDQDGTIKGGDDPIYTNIDVSELLRKIIRKDKYAVIITSSGASALKSFASIADFYWQKNTFVPTYIGIGSGTAIYKFDYNGRNQIYQRGLTLEDEKAIIQTWKDLYADLGIEDSDLQLKGIETFKEFMISDWTGYISPEYIGISKQYGGKCFTEPIKVTVVLPDWGAERQRKLVKILQVNLDNNYGPNKYTVKRGDDTFLHITHSFSIDPKLFALKVITEELDLQDKNIVAFGDLPLDNDRGLLVESGLPYTFTNHEFGEHNPHKPPYVLSGSRESPIGSVYKAIDYLLS